jgi:hypothetical protein
MKKTLLTIAVILLTLFSKSQDSIPNSGFEYWFNNGIPKFWQTTNLLLPNGVTNVSKTGNSYDGDWAVNLKTIDLEGTVVPGVATTGIIDFGATYSGVPFTLRPVSLNGFIQHPSSGDEVLIFVEFLKNGILIGSGSWMSSDSLPGFVPFSAPVNFYSPDDPDTMNITILSDPLKVGSMMTIDNLSFEFQITGIKEVLIEKSIAYPNPFRDNLYIDHETTIKSLQIFNLSGQQILIKESGFPVNRINLNYLKPGMYFLMIDTPDGILRQKIQKAN